jgi:hypothetical protein
MHYRFLFHDQHRCAAYAAVPQASKGFIGILQAERFNLCPDARLGGDLEEFFTIAAGQIGNGSNSALPPQDGIGKSWNIAHMDTCTHHGASFRGIAKRLGYQRADRSKQNGSIQLIRRRRCGISCPCCAKLAGKTLSGQITGFGESKYLASLLAGDLRDDVSGRTKTVYADPLCIAGGNQRPITDQPRAKQWCGFGIGIAFR